VVDAQVMVLMNDSTDRLHIPVWSKVYQLGQSPRCDEYLHETHYVSATEHSQLMLCKICSFHGWLWRMPSSGI
jgi:hypothetical protein